MIIVEGDDFTIEFDRADGFINRYDVNGIPMLAEGGRLTPNFWRAPTDNDFGAGLQRKYEAWRHPELKLKDLKASESDGIVSVKADYEMPGVNGVLGMTYMVNGMGEVMVTEDFKASEGAKVSPMFRFGMQMQMPSDFEYIDYYGRGPIENYSDRNHSTFIGRYSQQVADQYYPYIRPQETGTKTDIRWWRQLNRAGNGLEFTATAPFSASALDYSIDSLDDWPEKRQSHGSLVKKADYTNLCIDKAQMGLACVNSWGAIPLPEYTLPYGDYSFTFMMKPVSHQIPGGL